MLRLVRPWLFMSLGTALVLAAIVYQRPELIAGATALLLAQPLRSL